MFAASKTDSVSGAAPDGQFNYVTMLLHGDGTNGAQNNTFLDSSTNNFTITRNGNVTQGSFSPYGSNWSNFFDGNGDYLTCSASVPATGAFTVEMFLYPTSTAGYQLLFSQFTSGNAGSLQLLWDDTTDKFTVNIGLGTVLTSTSTYALNTWHHLAITRDGSNNMTMWVNGASAATTTNSTSILQTTTYIASRSALDGYFNGYISNLRVTNTAVYTTAFTPSTTPLTAISGTTLLTCADNRFIDDSASPKTLTVNGNTSVQRFNPFGTSTVYSTSVIGGSGYFDGSGDYLDTPTSSAFAFGTGDFTSELWVYLSRSNGTIIYEPRSSGQENNPSIAYGVVTSGKFEVITGSVQITSSSSFAIAQWHHVAIVRSGTTLTLWVNGTSQGTSTLSTNLTNNDRIRVGDYFTAGSYPFQGYVSNLRVVKGTAVYTSAFTPPTAPLTAISGTSLLTNFTNGAIFDNAMMNDLETVGNAQISTSVKKYGTGSLSFDGTGDYLRGANIPNLAFGTGDFTVECWAYWTATVADGGFLGSVGTAGFDFSYLEGTLRIGRVDTAWDSTFSSFTPTAGVWYHIAYTRSSGTARAFVNGTQVGSNSTNNNSYSPIGGVIIGSGNVGDRNFKGYIDDLRITKGYARYTANFTAPTAAFSDTGPY